MRRPRSAAQRNSSWSVGQRAQLVLLDHRDHVVPAIM
jgi:hypothetical protein